MSSQTNPPIPENIYGIFCGDINAATMQKLVKGLTNASVNGVKNLHILFQSWGGFVGDAIFLYNLLRTFPVNVTFYNGGHVASAGVLAFLGAKHRKTTRNALFMIHGISSSAQPTTLAALRMMGKNLSLEDERLRAIFRDNLKLPDDVWAALNHHDINISGEDAVTYGIADEIGEFSPPQTLKYLMLLVSHLYYCPLLPVWVSIIARTQNVGTPNNPSSHSQDWLCHYFFMCGLNTT